MEKRAEPVDEEKSTQMIEILAAAFVIILTLVLFALWRRRKSVGQNILVTGLSDTGKTLLYSRLMNSKFVQTQTSLKENIGDIIVNDRSLRLVAIPGDERLRYKFFDKYKSSAKAMIFMVDASTFQRNNRDVAEFLYILLSDEAMQRNIPVLILCNKQDQATAKGPNVIKILLQNEINLLRITKSNQLDATDESSTNAFLGKNEKDFEFHHLNCKVEFAECALFNKNADNPASLKQVHSWLQKIA